VPAIVGKGEFPRALKTALFGFFCPARHVSDYWLSILGLYSLICTFLARPNLAAWRVFWWKKLLHRTIECD
jgi:hypothetical protein